jgi:hypothetical protein
MCGAVAGAAGSGLGAGNGLGAGRAMGAIAAAFFMQHGASVPWA